MTVLLMVAVGVGIVAAAVGVVLFGVWSVLRMADPDRLFWDSEGEDD